MKLIYNIYFCILFLKFGIVSIDCFSFYFLFCLYFAFLFVFSMLDFVFNLKSSIANSPISLKIIIIFTVTKQVNQKGDGEGAASEMRWTPGEHASSKIQKG